MNPPSDFVIEFRGASYNAGGRTILDGLNLSVARGETLVLLGRSGSGKTTALKLVNRLLDPAAGDVQVDGRSTLDWDPIRLRRRIGYVIQEVGLFPHLTVERNVSLIPRLEDWPLDRQRARTDEMLRWVGLDPSEFGPRMTNQLSGGQRQRVGVARALAGDPPILLMDEPFGALDPLTRAEIQREFSALQSRLRKTVVFVTHDLREALSLATRIALIEHGRLYGIYSPKEFRAATDRVVSDYIAAYRGPEQGANDGTA